MYNNNNKNDINLLKNIINKNIINELNNDEYDSDYNPNNDIDNEILKNDKKLDRLFELENGYYNINKKINLLNNTSYNLYSSKLNENNNGGISYNIYLNDFKNEINELNFDKIVNWFNKFNKRNPNSNELKNMMKFLDINKNIKTKLNAFNEDDYIIKKNIKNEKNHNKNIDNSLNNKEILNTEIKYSKTKKSSAFNVYFKDPNSNNIVNDNNNNINKAKNAFKIFNKTEPSYDDEKMLKQFISIPNKNKLTKINNINIKFDDDYKQENSDDEKDIIIDID